MTTPAQPRHARAEIRSFAKWLRQQGWVYESQDSSLHTVWSHPKASSPYTLPETPRHFNVQRARRDVLKLMGQEPAGKRKPKTRPLPVAEHRPVVRRPAPARRSVSPAERQAERDFTFFDRLMREAPGSY